MTDGSGEGVEGLNPSGGSDPEATAGPGPRQPGPTERVDGVKPRKSRKRLLIALAGAGAMLVAVVVIAVITVTTRNSRSAGESAGDAVERYLEALARGDAETALSYGIDQPATNEFLTGEILKRQVAQWPIHDIRVLHDNSSDPDAALSMAHVHVVASFGGQNSDAVLNLRMDHKRWKLASAVIKFLPGLGASMGNAAAKTVTLFGRPISDATVYVFPGWTDIGTTNPYVTVTVPPLLLDQLTMAAPYWVYPTFVLADRGRDAVSTQLAAAMISCQHSHLLAPPDCPMHLDPDGLADGTAVWGAADLSTLKFDHLDSYRLTQTFSGQIRMPVTVKTSGGVTKQEEATQFLSGTADLAKIPPELTLR